MKTLNNLMVYSYMIGAAVSIIYLVSDLMHCATY